MTSSPPSSCTEESMSEYEKDRRWLDEATNQTRLFYVLIAVCVGLFGADFAI